MRFFILLLAASSSLAALSEKKLIEFGWDEPDTKFIREHIGEMRQTPFDGTVFHVTCRRADGHQGNFTWEAWGTNAFARADVDEAIQDLKQTDLGEFRENFFRFNTTPARLDWFDDYSAVVQNARLAAEFVHETHCAGILFDIEQYDGPLFDYRKQRDAYDKSKPRAKKAKSWEVYAAQVRERGREIMNAFQEGCPDPVIFLTFGYSLPWAESRGRVPLAECHYGLLAPFLDGMLSAAKGNARLIDGHEISYGWKTREQFAAGYKSMKEGLLPIVLDPERYARFFSAAFGLWLDRDWRKTGWNTEDPSKNYFTPESFESATRAALNQSDRYVWIYSETPRWWSAESKPVKLPSAYAEALRRAKAERGKQVRVERLFGPETPTGRYKHPACITELNNGDLYLAYYGGDGEYATATSVFGSRLPKGLDRWSSPRPIAQNPFQSMGNPVVWQAPDGLTWLFFVVRPGATWSSSRIMAKISRDEARTWSEPFTLEWEAGMMVRSRPILLASGEYLLPIYHETGADPEFTAPDTSSLFLRFDPKTKQWTESNRVHSRLGNLQPAVVQLSENHLLAFCRRGGDYKPRKDGFVVRTESQDGGKTWSEGVETKFPNPNAAVELIRLRNGHLLFVYNDSFNDRTPLTAAISTDDGKTFPRRINLAEGDGDFAYPTAIQTADGNIHVVFTSDERTVVRHAIFSEEAIAAR